MKEFAEGLECYVIQMDHKALEGLENVFKPAFYKMVCGENIHDGPVSLGDITEAHRFKSAGSTVHTVRALLSNPKVCNDTLDSYKISVRKLTCGIAMSSRLLDDGRVSLSE